MKLRIHENSLRIRVNRPDVEALRRDGSIEHCLAITAGARLTYRLELTDSGPLSAVLDAAHVTVRLPRSMAEPWFEDDAVSLTGSQENGADGELELLIEKDFACLVPRPGEDQSAYFENPSKAQE
jgi:hypothetical protein